MNTSFTYAVKIIDGSPFFASETIKNLFPSAREMVITSKPFNNYDECYEKLLSLLDALTTASSTTSKKNYVIVSRINPSLDKTGETKSIEGETWDDLTLIKAYVANADALKKSELRYTIIGAIIMSSGIDNLVNFDQS
jgi:hypothetical protein